MKGGILVDFGQIYVKSHSNYIFNMESIKGYLEDTVKTKNKSYMEDILEKEIVNELCKKYSADDALQVLIDNSNSFENLIKEIGLFEKYKNKVIFLDHEKYKADSDNIISKAKEEGKKICLSSSLIAGYFFDVRQEKELIIGFKMMLVYMHTVIDEFILDSIKTTMLLNQNSLRSKEQITFEDIIECGSYDEIINRLIDKKLDKLGRDSYETKINYLINGGIKLDIDEHLWKDDMILFCEIRNSLIHSKGQFSKSNIDKLKCTKYKEVLDIGYEVQLSKEVIEEKYNLINLVADRLYDAVCKKFNIHK